MLTICALRTWTLRLGHDKRYGKWIPQRPQQRPQKAARDGELLSAASATRRGTRERECERGIRGVHHGRDHQRQGKYPNAPLQTVIADSACPIITYFGQGEAFPGLIGLVETYISTLDLCELEQRKIASYLDLVRRRANGSLKTAATWIRDFVRSHPSYKFDSAVSKEINHDLVVAVDEM